MKHLLYVLAALLCLLPGCQRHRMNPTHPTQADSLLSEPIFTLFSEPEKADSLLQLAQKTTKDSLLWYKMELYRGFAAFVAGRNDDFEATLNRVKAFESRQGGRQPAFKGFRLNTEAVVRQLTGERRQAIERLEEAYRCYVEAETPDALPDVCINLADNNFQLGKMAEAAHYYRRALFLCDSLAYRKPVFAIETGLAQVYAAMRNFAEAHRHFDSGLAYEKEAASYERFHYYNSLGNCLFAEGRYEEALQAFQQLHPLVKEMQDKASRLVLDINLGETHLNLHHYDLAASYLRRAEALAASPGTDGTTRFYLNALMADLALHTQHLDDAGRRLSQPFDTAAIGSRYLAQHYRRLQAYYEHKGLDSEALRYYKLADRYEDSLQGVETKNFVAETQQRYAADTTLLHHRIALAEVRSENLRQKAWIAWGSAIFSLILLAGLAIWRWQRRRARQKYAQQLELLTELRMKIVRNRISPHFLYNVLGIVLPRLHDHPDVERPLNCLIDVLRDNLMVSDRLTINLAEEIALVEHFIALRGCINTDMPTIIWEKDDPLDLQMQIPAMSLQIPVENALKHAFPPGHTSNARITITLRSETNGLRMEVSDNGTGFHPAATIPGHDGTGVGLRALQQTVDLQNSQNTEKIILRIENRRDNGQICGTRIQIFIPKGCKTERTASYN
ncbi:MAG: histidine kinase [Alloprevotella sp.]